MRIILILFFIIPVLSFSQMSMIATTSYYTAEKKPKYGMLVNSATLTNDQKSDLVKDSFGCGYARTAIVASQWNGSSGRYNTYNGKGIKQVVNISYYSNSSGQNFLTGTLLDDFADTVALILDTYPNMEMMVLYNEEQNQTYHSGPITDYCNMLQTIYPIAHSRGIKLANGGIAGVGLDIKVYRWLVTKYGQSTADAYGAAAMSNAQINAAETVDSNPTLETAAKQVDTVLSYSNYYDYFNVHGYEIFSKTNTQTDTVTQVSQNIFRFIKEFIQESCHKPVMTNETGQRNNLQPNLVTNMMNEFYRLGFEYVLWFNGDSVDAADAQGLSDESTGVLRTNGTAFKNFISTHQ